MYNIAYSTQGDVPFLGEGTGFNNHFEESIKGMARPWLSHSSDFGSKRKC